MYCSEEADKRQKYLTHTVFRQDSEAVEALCTIVRRQKGRQKYLPYRVVRQGSKAVEAVCTVVRRQKHSSERSFHNQRVSCFDWLFGLKDN